MIPLRISLQGFMSYRDEQVLFFDGAPLWVLAGPNGAGKSAIFDAVTFALYGRHRGGAQNAQDLINHHANALSVEFDFLLDGTAYRIRRTVPRRGRPIRDAFLLTPSARNDEPHTELIPNTDSDKGFNDWVEHTIGLDYNTFTSSMLLLQGQSEKLLKAEPSMRYKILEELMDLSPYLRLYQAADEQRRKHDALAKSLSHQLRGVSIVSDTDLEAAQEAAHRAEEEWQGAQAEVEWLTKLIAQAKGWERLTKELEGQQSELEKVCKLLDRDDEIREGFGRWQELERVLPTLKSIVDQRRRLVGHANRIEELQRGIQQEQEKLASAESKVGDLKAKAEQLGRETHEMENSDRALANRLAELTPVVTRLEELEKTEGEIGRLKKLLAGYPSNLAQAVGKAEEKDRQLAKVVQALPWLEQLAQARSDLEKVSEKEQEVHGKLDTLETQLQGYQGRYAKIEHVLEKARTEENNLAHDVTRAQTKYEEACQRRDRFEGIASQPTCELCGQPITPEHARQERARLNAQVRAAKTNLNTLEAQHKEAESHRKGLEADLRDLDGQIAGLDAMCSQKQIEWNQAKRDAKHYADQIRRAFENLPSDYQELVATEAPSDDFGWLDTAYPTEAELKSLKGNASSRPAQAEHIQKLREQLGQWQHLDGQYQAANRRLAELTATCSRDEAQRARREQDKLKKQQEELHTQLEQWREALKKADTDSDRAHQTVETLRDQLQQHKTDLASKQATRSEIKRGLQSAIESLPANWQKQATLIGLDELEELQSEHERLAKYEDLATELERAHQSEAGLKRRINELKKQIGELSQEARRGSGEIEEELETAKNKSSSADTKRREAEAQRVKLEQRLEQRRNLEEMHCDADRQHHLYKLLANLLGRDGLQLHLLRRAEQAIVDLANEVMDGLSRGRMRLELRGANGQANTQSNKALDLVVYNYDTGPYPTAVALASGSQRFRIAVSLALAIGRYAGQESRRIESVIIDEGFGSLDKNGRDDMIQELNELKQQLARIILVSHQEEFTGAFVNGYAVELEDGASRVSLLEQAY